MRVNADSAYARPSLGIYLPKAASSGCASLTPDFCNCSGTIGVFTAMPALAHIAAEPHLSDARLESTSGQRRINFLSAVLGRLQPAIPGRRTQHRTQQRRCRCDDRDDLSDLMIQASPTHLDTRPYELTG